MPIPQWLSDSLIALSYFIIPAGLLLSARARRSLTARKILLLFAAFIVFCGGGHAQDAWFAWHGRCAAFSPPRQLWNSVTAILSIATAIIVVQYTPRYIRAVLQPLDMADLRIQILELQEILRQQEWRRGKELDH